MYHLQFGYFSECRDLVLVLKGTGPPQAYSAPGTRHFPEKPDLTSFPPHFTPELNSFVFNSQRGPVPNVVCARTCRYRWLISCGAVCGNSRLKRLSEPGSGKSRVFPGGADDGFSDIVSLSRDMSSRWASFYRNCFQDLTPNLVSSLFRFVCFVKL